MHRHAIAALAAFCLCWAGNAPAAGPDEGQWFVSPMATFAIGDSDRRVDDDLRGGQVGVGYALDPNWLLEGAFQYQDYTGIRPTVQRGMTLDLMHRWGPDWRLSPYALVGAGYLRSTPRDGLDRRRGASFSVGAGVMAGLAENVALRADYRIRGDASTPSMTDQLVSAGLVFSFGGPRAAPPAPVRETPLPREPEPEPEPEPAPPPPPPPPPPERPCPEPRPGQPVDEDGCALEISLPGVNFEFDSDRLLPGSERVLNEAAATLREYPNLRVEVQGHTDSRGDAGYNQRLSERRAAAVRDYLISRGVNADNLTARGHGETEPVASNETDEGRARNRRVVLRFIVD